MSDARVSEAVKNAVTAARSQHQKSMIFTLKGLLELPFDDVLAHLCFSVKEISAKKSAKTLIDKSFLPLPDRPMILVRGAENASPVKLIAYANGDRKKLIESLVLLVAGLEDSYERLL